MLLFLLAGSQGCQSYRINNYQIVFKKYLRRIYWSGKNVLATPDQVKPAGVKHVQTRADLGPTPAIRSRLWLVHTCARAETQQHRGEVRLSRLSCWDAPLSTGHEPVRRSTQARLGSVGVRESQDGEVTTVHLLLLMYSLLVNVAVVFLRSNLRQVKTIKTRIRVSDGGQIELCFLCFLFCRAVCLRSVLIFDPLLCFTAHTHTHTLFCCW